MLEDDADVAAYRDAVLWTGALARLSPAETITLCRLALVGEGPTVAMIGLGLFFLDDDTGAVLAIPNKSECVKAVAARLREAGLEKVAGRLMKSARGR